MDPSGEDPLLEDYEISIGNRGIYYKHILSNDYTNEEWDIMQNSIISAMTASMNYREFSYQPDLSGFGYGGGSGGVTHYIPDLNNFVIDKNYSDAYNVMQTQGIPAWIDNTNTGIEANTVNTVATVVPYISDIASNTLTSTKTGANIAYNYIAYNKYLLSGVKYLKPISYGASGVGIVSDVILTVEGQQSAVETGVNTGVTIGSMIVGGG